MPKTPGSGMPTDWEKYATPEQTRQRGRQPAEYYAIIQLVVGQVRLKLMTIYKTILRLE